MSKSKKPKLELHVLTELEADKVRVLLVRDVLVPNKESTQYKVDKVLFAIDAICSDVVRSANDAFRESRKEVVELENTVELLRRDNAELRDRVKVLESDEAKLVAECAGLRKTANVFVSREQLGKALDEAEAFNKSLRAENERLREKMSAMVKMPADELAGAPNVLQMVRAILGANGEPEMSVTAAANSMVERLREANKRGDLLQKERDLCVKERDEARSALSTVRKQWSDEAYVQHEELGKLSQALGQKKLLGRAQESLLDAAVRLSESAVDAENEAVAAMKKALGQSRYKDCTIDDVAAEVLMIAEAHSHLKAEHAVALKKIESLQSSCDSWRKFSEEDRERLAEALGYTQEPARSKRTKALIFDVAQLRSDRIDSASLHDGLAKALGLDANVSKSSLALLSAVSDLRANHHSTLESHASAQVRIADLQNALGDIGAALVGNGMDDLDPAERAETILRVVGLNYVHKDAVTGGRDRNYDCRVCAKTSRWNHDHETLGYVQKLCSGCFKEHGVVPTAQTLEDGSYAKATDAGKTGVAKELNGLRTELRDLKKELSAIKQSLGECWMEGNGRTVAGAVASVCRALDRANEAKNEMSTEYLRVLGEVQTALGDHYKNASLGRSTADIVRGVCKRVDEADALFEEYEVAFARILAALGVKTQHPTIAEKATACVSLIEAFISGYGLMDGTNKARRELFEKAAKVFEKLAEEWKIAGSAQVANTLGSAGGR
jgi:hypothetical protein